MATTPTNSESSGAQVANQLNSVARDLQAMQTTQVFKDEAGTRRVILDKDGLRTSPAGVDVFTAGNDEFTFNSNQNTFKVALSGTITLTKGAGVLYANITVAHSLGITPMCIAAIDYGGGAYYSLPQISIDDSTGAVVELVDCITSPTEVAFQVRAPSSGPWYALAQSFPIKYYILQETAN